MKKAVLRKGSATRARVLFVPGMCPPFAPGSASAGLRATAAARECSRCARPVLPPLTGCYTRGCSRSLAACCRSRLLAEARGKRNRCAVFLAECAGASSHFSVRTSGGATDAVCACALPDFVLIDIERGCIITVWLDSCARRRVAYCRGS